MGTKNFSKVSICGTFALDARIIGDAHFQCDVLHFTVNKRDVAGEPNGAT